MVEPHSSNFRVITTNFLGIRIFRKFSVLILSFRMDMSWQIVQTQRSSLIRVYTVSTSVCMFWTHDSIVEPHCLNFRISTAIFRVSDYLGVLRYFSWSSVFSTVETSCCVGVLRPFDIFQVIAGTVKLTYPHCSWASLLRSLPVLSTHSFASN